MFKGFYNLTSGMLTQQRNLNVVANNMTNVSTAGYKADQFTASTFDEVLWSRVGNKYKDGAEVIGPVSYILAPSQVYTSFEQGILEPTGITLDFALEGDGFFAIQDDQGNVAYTRAGSFSLDEEGYLCLGGQGRVLSRAGEPIVLMTDKVRGDEMGNIYLEDGGLLAQLGVFAFADNAALERNDQGLFVGQGAQLTDAAIVHWGYVERSNVDLVDQMTEMMTCQRALQSAAQVTKMYDELMTRASSEVGRLQ